MSILPKGQAGSYNTNMPQKIVINHLYKDHDNDDCMSLLYITRYLHYEGIDIMPEKITERFFPPNIVLPTIETPQGSFCGLAAILSFLQEQTGITNLYQKAHAFVRDNQNYRCRN